MTDRRGESVELLVDLEGTLYWKGELIPGALEALETLRSAGCSMRFLTNTDSSTPEQLRESLTHLGIRIGAAELFTPLRAARVFLSGIDQPRCRVLASAGVAAEFNDVGVTDVDDHVSHVLVGDCRDVFDYDRFNQAFRDLRDGAELLVLQPGRFFVRDGGEFIDTGAFGSLLEYASGCEARVIGKPSAEFFRLALADLGGSPASTVVVGDDATTDVTGALAIGARSVLVQTGKHGVSGAPTPPAECDVISSFAALPSLLGFR